MAYTGQWPYAIDSTLGVNFTLAIAPSTTGDGLAQALVPFTPGTTVIANGGGLWVLCVAGGTINQGDAVIFQGDTETVPQWTVVQLTSTNGKSKLGALVGLSGATAVIGNYIWVNRSGIFPAANINTTTPTVYTAMHSSGTAGQITTTATAGTSVAITGCVAELNAQIQGGNPVICNVMVIGAND